MENTPAQLLDHMLLDHLIEGVMIADQDLKIIYVNKSFCEITGYDLAEVLGSDTRLLKSGVHDATFYEDMWLTLETRGVWENQIWNRKKNGDVYLELVKISVIKDPESGEVIRYIAGFTDISEQRKLEEGMQFQLQHDELTGLLNRKAFLAQIDFMTHHASADPGSKNQLIAALIILDLDRFQQVSDNYGTAVGDEVLKQFAVRMLENVRSEDIVGRIGGDEFAIFLRRADVYTIDKIVRRILNKIRMPLQVGSYEFYVTASIGISLCDFDCREDPDFLIQRADAAMYTARERGGDTYEFYRPDMQKLSMQRFELETSLRRALSHDEFILNYQPQINVHTGGVAGLEVLLRWNQRGKGVILPSVFIPMAEETGLIIEIGRWVLWSACAQAKHWLDRGFEFERIAVNLSARQFGQGNLAEMVARILDETELPPGKLELEITESTAMADFDHASVILKEITSLGVTISIDDFGTGYSSLGTLRKLPISILKVDQSFVREVPQDPDSMAITEAIITMAHSLNMKVIAEGVETQEQVEFLRKNRCDVMQGYFYGYPMAVKEVEEWWEGR